jgi:hypothetical protein
VSRSPALCERRLGNTSELDEAELLGANPRIETSRSRPSRRSAFATVFRRCANASSTITNNAERSTCTGGNRGTMRTSTESTFGRGQKTSVPTRRTSRASARYATRRLTAPYACSPGPETRRSPTSRWTITT